jgi:diguanylate cyclase (GGDEF)-like protein/PAS domain S-box-containing protein
MQKKASTVHMLILDPSLNDAENLISLLRNSGRATRAHRITSEEDLEEALKNGNWDIMLARDTEQECPVDAALAMLRRLGKDIPFILLTDDYDAARATAVLKAGGQDTVPYSEQALLVLVVNRELTDLDERRRRRLLESHLREAEQRCQRLLESSKDAIAYVIEGMHVYANESYLEFLGYDDIDELMCIPVLDTLGSQSQDDYRQLIKGFADQSSERMSQKITARRSDGRELTANMQASPATFDGERCTQIVLQPEHNGAELEKKLMQISNQDLLTGLYNRSFFMASLAEAITQAGASNESGSLAYISLDNFAPLKRDVGITGVDFLLRDLATLLREQVGADMTLARLSDDSFALLYLPYSENDMVSLAQGICTAIEGSLFDVDGRSVQLTVSIGVAGVTENSPKAEELMARAHRASVELKKQNEQTHGNGVRVHNAAEHRMLNDNTAIDCINRALDNDQFRLLFQPVINLRGESEEHYEVYVRMLDDKGEDISPYNFLPPLGPTDTAVKIDRWVFLQAIKKLAAHRVKGQNTRLFLNVTTETLHDKTFTPWLSVALKAARLPGDTLIFQLRECDANNFTKQAKDFAKTLHQLHCKVSITQFGCTLNPFHALNHIDTDYIKIDSSFTEELQNDHDARERLKEMVQSLQSAGKLSIVPLVESAGILATLWQAGVNYIQGYYLQPPTPEMTYDFSDN